MRAEKLKKIVVFGQNVGNIFMATADDRGLPHIGAASRIDLVSEKELAVSAWFCPGTMENLKKNPRISLVIWDPDKDEGYQLLGESMGVKETAMMDGFSPELEKQPSMPQIERKVFVKVETILDFSNAPHTDQEE